MECVFAVFTCVLGVSDVLMYIRRFFLLILISSRTSQVKGKAFGAKKKFLLFADSQAYEESKHADLHRTQKNVS